MLITLLVVIAMATLAFSQDKKDTATANSGIITQQTSEKGLAKQTQIRPKVLSNWSKIKDLFM
jgi:hypothetical protein